MKIGNLKEGMLIKNYKELCELLKINIASGASKRSQMREFERYCSYRKEGYKFLIEKIYDEPLAKKFKKGSGRGNTVFSDIIQVLILDTLVKEREENNTIIKTRNQLLLAIGAVNINYNKYTDNTSRLSDLVNIDKPIVKDFYDTSNSNFKGTLEAALNSLRRKALLMYDKVNMVSYNNVHREATAIERELILKVEIEILQEMGYRDIYDVMTSTQWSTFKSKQSKLLRDYGAEFKFSYVAYRITANELHYLEAEYDYLLDHILSNQDRIDYIEKLNNLVSERLLSNAKNRHMKAIKNTGIGEPIKHRAQREKSEYIQSFKDLIAYLVQKDTKEI